MGIWTIPTANSPTRPSPVTRRRGLTRRPGRSRAGLFAWGYPGVGSGVYVAVGIVAAHGLGLTPIALLVAGVVFAAAAFACAEGMSMFPGEGGGAALARHAFDELTSFATGWATCVWLTAAAAAAALFSVQYLSVFWSPLGSGGWAAAGTVVVLGVIAAAAMVGVERSLRLDGALGVVDLFVQLLLVFVGLVFMVRPEYVRRGLEMGSTPPGQQLALAVAIAIVAYAGTDSIGDLAAEARDPAHDVRPATGALIATAPLLAAALAVVSLMALPVVQGAHASATTLLAQGPPNGYRNYPMLGIVSAVPLSVVATGLRYLVGLLVSIVLVVFASAALRRCGRLAGWLGRHNQLPRDVAALHPEYETPYRALGAAAVAAGLLAVAQAVSGGPGLLVGVWAYAALWALTFVQVAVIALRIRDKGRYRLFAIPIAVPIAGAVATACGWIVLVVFDGGARDVATVVMVAGLAGYAVYRRHLGLSLTERTQPEVVVPAGPGIAIEFQTMLVPVNTADPDLPNDAIDVAVQLAAERRASLVVLAFTEIPLGEVMDMDIDGLDERVERLGIAARMIAERYGIRVHVTHLRTRDPAETILAEAARRESQVILLGVSGRDPVASRRVAYDQVVRRIVAEATQRVMVIRPPQVVRT
ncbi:MAG TPA: amino acid permease [Gaiellales bacterium]|jgi:APA family basic amino acid/polyamine antiporter|nr:amino acid permease [Gaiellales bacterium]